MADVEDLTDVRLGREVVASGQLQELREHIGVARSVMAEYLHTSIVTYSLWESRRPATSIRPSTASRIGRFYRFATTQLLDLANWGVSIKDLVPLHVAASNLGMPQEVLFLWHKEERFKAVDLGVLGLWLHPDQIEQLAQ